MPPVDESHDRAPRWLPPRLADVGLIALSILFSWLVILRGLTIDEAIPHDWSLLAGAAASPFAAALWWRRTHPLAVLGVALLVTIGAFPATGLFGSIALGAAASRVAVSKAVAAGVVSLGIVFAGRQITFGSIGWTNVIELTIGVAVVTAVGLYLGARRQYFDRLRERALFARALASFLPAGVAELIEASPSALSLDEEIEATILFSDIRGFSTVAEELPPREVAEIVGRHAAAMAEVIRANGGIVDKFAGDGVMALFGAPVPRPGDADRAIACAIGMQRRQAELNEEARDTGSPTTEIGIGVNTGNVIAGTLGGAGRLEYTVIGDAVNVAQRLQSVAEAGEILVAAATVNLASWSAAEAAGRRRLKGRRSRSRSSGSPGACPL